jgi:hypothetical protein
MKVLWISDFPPDTTQFGGAEATMDIYGGYGKHRGHTSSYAGTRVQYDLSDISKEFDCMIFYNTFFFEHQALLEAIGEIPHVNFECDFGFCKFRYPKCLEFTRMLGYAPCEECPYTETPTPQLKESHVEIMKTAKINFFMSPLQYNAFLSCIPEIRELDNSFILPPMIDEHRFFPLNQERKGALYVGQFAPNKGVMNALRYAVTHPSERVMFVGFSPEGMIFPGNCIIMGKVSNEHMNTVYNMVDSVILLPEIIDTCPRVAFEAILAGCTILPNSNVGTLSLDWPLSDPILLRKKIRESPIRFWESLTGVVDEGIDNS